jgi:hypothetical protein
MPIAIPTELEQGQASKTARDAEFDPILLSLL